MLSSILIAGVSMHPPLGMLGGPGGPVSRRLCEVSSELQDVRYGLVRVHRRFRSAFTSEGTEICVGICAVAGRSCLDVSVTSLGEGMKAGLA